MYCIATFKPDCIKIRHGYRWEYKELIEGKLEVVLEKLKTIVLLLYVFINSNLFNYWLYMST